MAPKVKENNPFHRIFKELEGFGFFYSLPALDDPRVARLPYSIRVLLESSLRNCDNFEITEKDVETVLDWENASVQTKEIAFKPARVLLQDLTGVPAAVDLAGMRDGMARLGGDPQKINPLVPVDLVVDHSVQVDVSRSPEALERNQEIEFKRNGERFAFLKWTAQAFKNFLIVPPGSGIVHQVNLEYLGRVVFDRKGVLYPDSVVGTDSHTTMIGGLGILGWGVGGIEAEAVMLGQPISMVLPEVIGFKMTGQLKPEVTATDLVLTVTKMLRQRGVVGKFVEFYGDGCKDLSLADRATISNMAPEYGATIGFFPVDAETIKYLADSGREPKLVEMVEKYLRAQSLFRNYDSSDDQIQYSGASLELDLSTVVPSVSGPKRPHDRVAVAELKEDFQKCLIAPLGFKGFALPQERVSESVPFKFQGKDYTLRHGSIVIAAITSCTNTSNPAVMLGAGMVARNALAKGLSVPPYIKTSLSPGSGVVRKYLESSKLLADLESLGFYLCGFGCQTCIGNSGELDAEVNVAITAKDLVVCAVLSGNRNFEGRVHPLTRANYLMSPMLVVAYALVGRVDVDFESEPLGNDKDGKPVYLRDIWPSRSEIIEVINSHIASEMFKEVYAKIATGGSEEWQKLKVPDSELFKWDPTSTYIHDPPFFKTCDVEPAPIRNITDAAVLLKVGDSVTTDHISPAGSISKTSPAAKYLTERGVTQRNFNTYGARRGNDEIMARGTFANVRLINQMASKPGPLAVHVPSGTEMSVFDVAQKYAEEGRELVILTGKEYGCGSSRDWAAKGPQLMGVRAVIAESFERIHRSNLVGMGVLPLQYLQGEDASTYQLDGTELFTIGLADQELRVGQEINVIVKRKDGSEFVMKTKSRLDTEVELSYFKHGGILLYVLRKLLKAGGDNSP